MPNSHLKVEKMSKLSFTASNLSSHHNERGKINILDATSSKPEVSGFLYVALNAYNTERTIDIRIYLLKQ